MVKSFWIFFFEHKKKLWVKSISKDLCTSAEENANRNISIIRVRSLTYYILMPFLSRYCYVQFVFKNRMNFTARQSEYRRFLMPVTVVSESYRIKKSYTNYYYYYSQTRSHANSVHFAKRSLRLHFLCFRICAESKDALRLWTEIVALFEVCYFLFEHFLPRWMHAARKKYLEASKVDLYMWTKKKNLFKRGTKWCRVRFWCDAIILLWLVFRFDWHNPQTNKYEFHMRIT